MLGNAFAPTMRAAQAGDERAFARLWRDANPLMVRYLRVIGVEDPYDSACEGWVSIVRGVSAFEGDEKDWRLWVCTCARMCAEEKSLRSSWSPFRSRPSVEEMDDSIDDLELEDLMDSAASDDPRHRDVNATISALRSLPMGQGEVVDLRFGWGLPSKDVAGLVGLDTSKVRRAEARALERLETPADLLEWSLNAPPTPAELADERIATAAFRSLPRGSHNPVGKARIIAIGTGRPSGAFPRGGHSKTALLGIAAISASLMSVGGLSAAAYVGVLPAPMQKIAHDVVGAPAPADPTVKAPSTGSAGGRAVPTVGVGPDATATAKAAPGLCRAWSADKANGTPGRSSVAFRNLSRAAGGDGAVEAYCAAVLAPGGPGKGAPTAGTKTPNPHSPTSKPGSTKTPNTKGSSTKSPTRSPSTNSPTTKATSKGSSTKAPKPTTTKAPKGTPTQAGRQATPTADAPPGGGTGQPTAR